MTRQLLRRGSNNLTKYVHDEDVRSAVIYGGNFLVGFLTRYGNLLGAAIFGGERIAEAFISGLSTNPYTRVAKTIAAGTYGLFTLSNLGSGNIGSAFFDATMAFELGMETAKSNGHGSLGSAFRKVGNDISNLFDNSK